VRRKCYEVTASVEFKLNDAQMSNTIIHAPGNMSRGETGGIIMGYGIFGWNRGGTPNPIPWIWGFAGRIFFYKNDIEICIISCVLIAIKSFLY